MKEQTGSRTDIYARITDRIVAELAKGVRPWVQPWSVGNTAGRITRPLRHNGEPYSGLNVLLLWSEAVARGFTAPTWMTFRQARELGAHVRKGEISTTVIYASRFTKTETDARGDEVERAIPFLKAYGVFNVGQIDGLPERYYATALPVLDPLESIAQADLSSHTPVRSSAMAARGRSIRPRATTSRCRRSSRSAIPPPTSPC